MSHTNNTQQTEIVELLKRYERLQAFLHSLDDKRGLPLLQSIELNIPRIREYLKQNESRGREAQILAGLRQGLRDLRLLMSWAPDGIADRAVAISQGRDSEQTAVLAKIMRNSRISNRDEFEVARQRCDEIAGDPDFARELTILQRLLKHYENI